MFHPFAKIDRPFLIITLVLITFGFLIFCSAALGLLARSGAPFSVVATNQIVFGIIGGLGALFFALLLPLSFLFKYSWWFLAGAVILMLLVFIPGIGLEAGGARRWIDLGIATFQPSELLKIALILVYARTLSKAKQHVQSFQNGLLPLLILLSLSGTLMLLQPDTGTFLIMAASLVAMFIAAGGRARDLTILFLIAVVGIMILAFFRPYVADRISTFIDPNSDPHGSSYQLQQSLIAIGSGGLWGRGFGQSVQKFDYLPEPIGDSIFAVYAEEFGFLGSMVLLSLFVALSLRGLRIASNAKDLFGGLVVVGIVILITSQSYVNMAAMLGLIPLTGVPLLFVSHGGSALLLALFEVGLVLNISRRRT